MVDPNKMRNKAEKFMRSQQSATAYEQTQLSDARDRQTARGVDPAWGESADGAGHTLGHVAIALVAAPIEMVAASKGRAAAKLFFKNGVEESVESEPTVISDDPQAQKAIKLHGFEMADTVYPLSEIASEAAGQITSKDDLLNASAEVALERAAKGSNGESEENPTTDEAAGDIRGDGKEVVALVNRARRKGAFESLGPSVECSFVDEGGKRIVSASALCERLEGSDEDLWLVPTLTKHQIRKTQAPLPPEARGDSERANGTPSTESSSDDEGGESEMLTLGDGTEVRKPSAVPKNTSDHGERQSKSGSDDRDHWVPGDSTRIKCNGCGRKVPHEHVPEKDASELTNCEPAIEEARRDDDISVFVYRCTVCSSERGLRWY